MFGHFLVLRAHDVPIHHTRTQRELEKWKISYISITYGETERRTKSVRIEGQTAEWNESLGALWDFPLLGLIFSANSSVQFRRAVYTSFTGSL